LLTIILLSILTILTGCSSKVVYPELKPVVVKPSKIKPCGTFKYYVKNGKVIIDYDTAKCLREALATCAKDRKKFIVANKANVRQMLLLKRRSK